MGGRRKNKEKRKREKKIYPLVNSQMIPVVRIDHTEARSSEHHPRILHE